ncbi:hypothetical protein Hdeb2414_s0016g00493911 [Helianthus debilis subsp. tardiflorus]
MSDHRDESAKKARIAGHTILENEYDFSVMCEYPPHFVHEDIWHELCMRWNTDEWQKKSERGKSNRKKADSDDVISRHTGGSMGYDEHRIILVKIIMFINFSTCFFNTYYINHTYVFFVGTDIGSATHF